MNELRIPCSPCQIIVLQEVTEDPIFDYVAIIVIYPIGIIDIFENGIMTASVNYDTKVPA